MRPECPRARSRSRITVAGALGVLVEHRGDGFGVGVEHRPRRCPLVAGRVVGGGEARHRVAAHAELLGDRGVGPVLALEAADLGPVLHVVHPFLPRVGVTRRFG